MIATSSLRLSLRRLRQRPGFAAIAVLSLAIGIGANVAVFGLLDSLLLRPLPFADPDSLLDVYLQQDDFPTSPFSYPDFEDLREATRDQFEGLVISGFSFAQGEAADGGVEPLMAELVSNDFFSLLGLQLALGRGFSDDQGNDRVSAPVAVLDWDYWQRHFAGRDVIGEAVRLNGREFTIVGVAPQSFEGSIRGVQIDLFLPVAFDPQFAPDGEGRLDSRGSHWAFVRGRLRPGVGEAELQTVLDATAQRLAAEHPDDWQGKLGFTTVPTARVIVNPTLDPFVRSAAGALLALVMLVLAIACANLAGFLLARATDERKETAVRCALGAARWTLIRQRLLDALVVAACGGALGTVLAGAAMRALAGLQLPGFPVALEAGIDGRVLLFAVFATALASLLFGLAPALHATRLQPVEVLKDETTGGAHKQRLRAVLVVAQVAVCTVLLAGAGLFLRSLEAMNAYDPGFGAAPTGIVSAGLPPEQYPDAEARREFFRQLEERLRALPGASEVGSIDNLHLNLGNQQSLRMLVDGMPPAEGSNHHAIDYASATPGFFSAAGVRLLEGRTFEDGDDAESTRVAVVTRSFAERFYPGRSAIGESFSRANGERYTVVGVTEDIAVRLMGDRGRPFVYLASAQWDPAALTVLVRTEGDAEQMATTMLREARALEPDLLVWENKTMRDHVGLQMLPARALAASFAAFAVVALLLAAVGLYGVVSFAAASREREIGIRRSLGATSLDVVRLLTRSGMRLVAIGAVAGLALAFAAARLIDNLVFGVRSAEPVTWIGAVAVLLLVTGAATVWPAVRALRRSPAGALRLG